MAGHIPDVITQVELVTVCANFARPFTPAWGKAPLFLGLPATTAAMTLVDSHFAQVKRGRYCGRRAAVLYGGGELFAWPMRANSRRAQDQDEAGRERRLA
jgi:hypothetical protein